MPTDSEWMSWPEAAELVGCPVPTIDWHTRTGRITTRPFHGTRPTLLRTSVEEFATWWATRQDDRAERRRKRQGRPGPRAADPPAVGSWLDTAQAADRLGVSRQHVPWLAERGVIRGIQKGQRWWLEEPSVDAECLRRQRDQTLWVSQTEAARMAHCSPQTILAAARAGQITQRHLTRGYPSLLRASVEAYAEERRRNVQQHERTAPRRAASAPPDDEHVWLSSAQTAQVLGLSRRRVDQLAVRESLPFTQQGHRRWFRADHIDLVVRARRAAEVWH